MILDGAWSDWDKWSDCNFQTGKKERQRTCSNPVPINGGKPCAGNDKEQESCPGSFYI